MWLKLFFCYQELVDCSFFFFIGNPTWLLFQWIQFYEAFLSCSITKLLLLLQFGSAMVSVSWGKKKKKLSTILDGLDPFWKWPISLCLSTPGFSLTSASLLPGRYVVRMWARFLPSCCTIFFFKSLHWRHSMKYLKSPGASKVWDPAAEKDICLK